MALKRETVEGRDTISTREATVANHEQEKTSPQWPMESSGQQVQQQQVYLILKDPKCVEIFAWQDVIHADQSLAKLDVEAAVAQTGR
jgi:hypothetical protein